jgi:microcin C transport system substrate-binding protein
MVLSAGCPAASGISGGFNLRLSRRSLLRAGLIAAAAPATGQLGRFTVPALAQEPEWRHGLSLFDAPREAPDFTHFGYVNPNAPKGGAVRIGVMGTFDNFNLAVGMVRGTLASSVIFIYDTLLVSSLDEVSADYGLLAEGVSHPPDFSSVTYRLRPQARFHDGKPVTPEDVMFSMETFQKNDPQLAAYYRHVVKMEKIGDRDVLFTFDSPGNRELPLIVGQLTVLPKHWWEGTDASGNKRDVGATTLEVPLGSGAYRIKEFVAGRSIVLERVKDYWGKDLNVNIGRDNFDQLRMEYFRDDTVALEAFKADQLDWRTEASAKNWATAYDFPAVKDKRVLLEEFPTRNVGVMQGIALNTRREKFKDARVRRALNYVYDFEEMNKQLFFGQYKRIASYFENTELACSGLPQGRELEILETVRAQVPPEVFTTAYSNPRGGSADLVRNNLREALRLMREGGYEIRDRKLINVKSGEPLSMEFLLDDPALERIVLFYKPALERLGVTVVVRTVDNAQYENRLRSWDFDAIMTVWPESLSPGNEQRDFWGSEAADRSGSRNYIGIKNPAVDALIQKVIFSTSRDDLVAATHALDRVLLWNHYVVPQFTYDKTRTARWDRFARPDPMPKYGRSAFPTIWWWDAEKAAKTGSRQ